MTTKRRLLVLAGSTVLLSAGLLQGCAVTPLPHAAAVATAPPLRQVWAQPGWSPLYRSFFYGFSQGSRIVPLAWFKSLKRTDKDELFAADGLARYGYLPWPATMANPSGAVAIGVTPDPDPAPIAKGGGWIGMNCAACHTGVIDYKGIEYIVDGGPAQTDFTGFYTDLSRALTATARDSGRFADFAARVAQAGGESNSKTLQGYLDGFAARFQTFADNSQPHRPPLSGRMDAFTLIMNRVVSIDLGDLPFPNTRFPDGPVRYPWLWNTNAYAKVQYTGNVDNNRLLGQPGRNFGQALGVFAQVPDLTTTPRELLPDLANVELPHYASSIHVKAQIQANTKLNSLTPPLWPDPIDEPKRACGEAVFWGGHMADGGAKPASCDADAAVNCASCHTPPARGVSQFPVQTVGIGAHCSGRKCGLGTDSRAAYLLACSKASTGPLAGTWYLSKTFPFITRYEPANELVSSIALTERIGLNALVYEASKEELSLSPSATAEEAIAPRSHISAAVSGTAPAAAARQTVLAQAKAVGQIFQPPAAATADQCAAFDVPDPSEPPSAPPGLAYRAVALNGVWAAGRYLHNGSVPTLWDLLKPSCAPSDSRADTSACRPNRFTVGSRFYDADDVGYRHGPGDGAVFDTSSWGDHNTGHEGAIYGTGLTDTQKRELLEYLKSL